MKTNFYKIYFLLFISFVQLKANKPQVDQSTVRDLRWPNRRLNVLIDKENSINLEEYKILLSIFDQLEHRTCIKVNILSTESANPFNPATFGEDERNFMYIFKSQLDRYARTSSIGLSSLGCLKQGRQSLVLTDLAFRWPQIVLRYHILRSLGLDGLDKPDKEVEKLVSGDLPLNQKISDREAEAESKSGSHFDPAPTAFLYASRDSKNQQNEPSKKQYLSDKDIELIKRLYDCSYYQSKLSPSSLSISTQATTTTITSTTMAPMLTSAKPESGSANMNDIHKNESEIIEFMLNLGPQEKVGEECLPMQSCPLRELLSERQRSLEPERVPFKERPMIMKLDPFNALDPHIQRANRMKLSQLTGDSVKNFPPLATSGDKKMLETTNDSLSYFNSDYSQTGKTNEMLIAFEQVPTQTEGNPASALINSQVLKVCSCTCQAMTPTGGKTQTTVRPIIPSEPITFPNPIPNPFPDPNSSPFPLPSQNTFATYPSLPTFTDYIIPTEPPFIPPLTFPPLITIEPPYVNPSEIYPSVYPPNGDSEQPTDEVPKIPTSTPTQKPTKKPTKKPSDKPSTDDQTFEPDYPETDTEDYDQYSTMLPSTTKCPTPSTIDTSTATPTKTTTSYPSSSCFPSCAPEVPPTTTPSPAINLQACDQVQWVRPNKTVYSSSKIVWDVDRANQNYFICNALVDNELIPGKTHGFSCKVSANGKTVELDQFNVLTKPEKVNLAWIQKSNSGLIFGNRSTDDGGESSSKNQFRKKNLPVVGGFSKENDSYVVSRCLVKDENNDVITLIGYINTNSDTGIALFPFDDIQIECSQYDILACVS